MLAVFLCQVVSKASYERHRVRVEGGGAHGAILII